MTRSGVITVQPTLTFGEYGSEKGFDVGKSYKTQIPGPIEGVLISAMNRADRRKMLSRRATKRRNQVSK